MSGWRERAAGLVASGPVSSVVKAVGVRPLVCLGDSHLRPMYAARRSLRRTACSITVVSGASATGIAHDDSQTKARARFQAVTRRLHPDSAVLVSLGEVDVGFLAFVHAQMHGGEPQDYASRALQRLTQFLEVEVLRRGAQLLMLSAIPPTIEDYATWSGFENKRRLVTASRSERAALTSRWNSEVAAWCDRVGADWLDLTPHVLEPGTTLVRREWVNPDPLDQHLHPERHAALLVSLLQAQDFR